MTAPDETLEALVRDELRGPIGELVRRLMPKLVAEALNRPVARGVRKLGHILRKGRRRRSGQVA